MASVSSSQLDFLNDLLSKVGSKRRLEPDESGGMATTERALRESIIAHGATAVDAGLGSGLVSDISARFNDSLPIPPSGANYAGLRPAMIELMPLVGEYRAWKGPKRQANGAFTSILCEPVPTSAELSVSSRLTPRLSP